METSKFFVSNLPVNTSEKDIKRLFKDYGEINNIELKRKANLVDPDDIKIIAFVTLNIGQDGAQYCVNDLNWQKVHGQEIKVSFAKESFLDRLKREREEAKSGQDNSVNQATQQTCEPQSDFLNLPRENKRKTFDVDAELDDDEVAPELMIVKKRAASSLHNGKIVIQTHNVEPIHVIENKQKNKKQLDNKSSSADQKRKESLNKMKNQYEQKKNAIQHALQAMGSNGTTSKKIKFSDAESDQEENKTTAKTNIFGSDDDNEEEDDVNFKSVPLGKKGEKLAKMRAEQSLDPRFLIDEKFVDDVDEQDENDVEQNQQNNVDDERQWQMNILEQVTGTKINAVNDTGKSHKNKKMLRYDPSKDDHKKFERSKEEQNQVKKSKKKASREDENVSEEKNSSNTPEVSKEVFYVVTDTLQQSLRTRGEGFSLLQMFGRNEQLEKRDEKLKELGNEKILVNNKLEKSFAVNPFSYDSSSESEEEEITNKQINGISNVPNDTKSAKKSKKNGKIFMESFFIPKNDTRLKEGAKFFIYKKADDATPENYEEVRNRLKLLIKTKISKTKKNLVNAGYKGKRKV